MDKRVLLSVMPGDNIEWDVEVFSRARMTMVWAIFVRDDEEQPGRMVLGGEVHSFEKPTAEGRTNHARLVYYEEHSDQLDYGDYRLESIECVTHNRSHLQVKPESVPPATIRFEREPAGEVPSLGGTHIRTT